MRTVEKKSQTLEESVTLFFVAHVKFSEKILAANARYHTRKINLVNEVQGAVRKTPKSLEEFSFLRLMETLIMTNAVAGYKSSWSGGKKFWLPNAKNLFCLTSENFSRGFYQQSIYSYLLRLVINLLSQSGLPYFTSNHNSVTIGTYRVNSGILGSIWYKNGIRKPN